MRTLLHTGAILLALPQILLAAAFLLLGHVTGGRTLGSLLSRSLDVFFALFSWGGLLAIATFVGLLLAGFFPRALPIAAGIVALLVVASAVSLIVQVGAGIGIGEAWIFLPGLLSLTASVWLIVTRVPQ